MSLKTIVLKQLEVRHGEDYAASKAERLEGLSGNDVLFWATHALDAEAQVELRNVLEVSEQEWEAAAKVMLKVNNI